MTCRSHPRVYPAENGHSSQVHSTALSRQLSECSDAEKEAVQRNQNPLDCSTISTHVGRNAKNAALPREIAGDWAYRGMTGYSRSSSPSVTLVVTHRPNSIGSPREYLSPMVSARRKRPQLFTRANSRPRSWPLWPNPARIYTKASPNISLDLNQRTPVDDDQRMTRRAR